MKRLLSISDFTPRGRTPMSAVPQAGRLASLIADSCSRSLSQVSTASWRVTPDRIDETNTPHSHTFGVAIRFDSSAGSLAAHLILDRPVVSALMDAVMGGSGTEPPFEMGERPLSAIEIDVLNFISRHLAEEISKVLSTQFGRDFAYALVDQTGAQPTSALESVSFHFLVNVYGHSGEIRLCMLRDELDGQIESSSPDKDDTKSRALRQMLQKQVGKSDVEFVVTLGPETLSIADVSELRAGQMIALSSTVKTPVTLWSGGVAALHGTLMRSGDRMAVSITASLV